MTGWNADNAAGPAGAGAVTVLDGSSFCLTASNGDMLSGSPHGAFFHDTRYISEWNITVDDAPLEALAATALEPFQALFIGRVRGHVGSADPPLLIERERIIGAGLTETITIENHLAVPNNFRLALTVNADFADLFDVKDGRAASPGPRQVRMEGDSLLVECEGAGRRHGLAVRAPGATLEAHRLILTPTIPAHGKWTQSFTATPYLDGQALISTAAYGTAEVSAEARKRLSSWRMSMPIPNLGDASVQNTILRSQEDLGSLRIFDPGHPDRVVAAAGAPWFMALFGRDSLLSSLMSLLLDPSLALGTLQTLADHQGKEVNPATEEEPGRILHEVRLGTSTESVLGGRSIYYGTADATPLFVTILSELGRWGLETDAVRALVPAADRALAWIENYGDRDGDGFVEYQRQTEHGLINQGWKDSWDGINFADGSLARGPIALCEVQAYTYGAYVGRALMAVADNDRKTADLWTAKAIRLKEAFNERFWLPDRGYFAIALDGDKKPVDALASNMGHCLWMGIVDTDKAAQVAERLMSPEMFTGWGIRTLASTMGAYNPLSYHNGSVWPHDSTLVAHGLMRYGFIEEAQRIAYGLFEAAEHFGGRLPELFCGLDRARFPHPVPYPAACSPQAWAAAAPIHLIRMLMRFDPALPWNELWLAPELPKGFGQFKVDNVPFAGNRLAINIRQDSVTVDGLPDSIRLRLEARPALRDLLNLRKYPAHRLHQ
ncbi:glycogen debranching N-terminal domain-containing protein [Pseudarthrobacter sp. AL07]|uniref:amylo-alpha-1,6-glucosidase n=1 Tax=unclassified Pseudarthrobacter TaxID=2647000 RepID=UPI00249BBE73|nr:MULTISPECIES: glycogen debranching N-terminal domain-containing protein [unclassified Pseudarthrobacter]MDI3195449.1 glycogen debranching N-terminal domain-containing protein [Pseudarthrobacter sp. AL20]MDI3209516.1 glycogen debranching N-terminal domain-containing protein [Pseudarthrobacter sp. AL07]